MSELQYKVTIIVPAKSLHPAIEATHNLEGMTYRVELFDPTEENVKSKPVCRTRGTQDVEQR
jgi:hypothetical protein